MEAVNLPSNTLAANTKTNMLGVILVQTPTNTTFNLKLAWERIKLWHILCLLAAYVSELRLSRKIRDEPKNLERPSHTANSQHLITDLLFTFFGLFAGSEIG
jgi:hypothetical protein